MSVNRNVTTPDGAAMFIGSTSDPRFAGDVIVCLGTGSDLGF